MKYTIPVFLVLCAAVSGAAGMTGSSHSTVLLAAARKLQADVNSALPRTKLSGEEQARLKADAAQLVTNATIRAQGGKPNRWKGRSAAMDIYHHLGGGRFPAADRDQIKKDLKELRAAAG